MASRRLSFMSPRLAKSLSKDMNMSFLPACCQPHLAGSQSAQSLFHIPMCVSASVCASLFHSICPIRGAECATLSNRARDAWVDQQPLHSASKSHAHEGGAQMGRCTQAEPSLSMHAGHAVVQRDMYTERLANAVKGEPMLRALPRR